MGTFQERVYDHIQNRIMELDRKTTQVVVVPPEFIVGPNFLTDLTPPYMKRIVTLNKAMVEEAHRLAGQLTSANGNAGSVASFKDQISLWKEIGAVTTGVKNTRPHYATDTVGWMRKRWFLMVTPDLPGNPNLTMQKDWPADHVLRGNAQTRALLPEPYQRGPLQCVAVEFMYRYEGQEKPGVKTPFLDGEDGYFSFVSPETFPRYDLLRRAVDLLALLKQGPGSPTMRALREDPCMQTLEALLRTCRKTSDVALVLPQPLWPLVRSIPRYKYAPAKGVLLPEKSFTHGRRVNNKTRARLRNDPSAPTLPEVHELMQRITRSTLQASVGVKDWTEPAGSVISGDDWEAKVKQRSALDMLVITDVSAVMDCAQ